MSHASYGLAPTAVAFCAVVIAALRGSYDALTGELLRLLGARRHVLLAGAGVIRGTPLMHTIARPRRLGTLVRHDA